MLHSISLFMSSQVPPRPVILQVPEDVIEGQASDFTCRGIHDNTGSLSLAMYDDVIGQFKTTAGDSTDVVVVSSDTCKSELNVTVTLTLTAGDNSTLFRCVTSSPDSVSDAQTVLVIPCKIYV